MVTSMKVGLHDKQETLSGMVIFPWHEAESVLGRYASLARTAPDEVGLPVALMSSPSGDPMVLCLPLWNGDKQTGERYIDDLQKIGTAQLAQVGPTTYGGMLGLFDASVDALAGSHWETRTRSLPALTTEAIKIIVDAVTLRTSPLSAVNWHYFHGAATRVAPDETAFGIRSEHFMIEIVAAWAATDERGAEHRKWAQDLSESLAPFALQGGYSNYLTDRDKEQTKYAFGKNGDRLRRLKTHFDPRGLFRSSFPLPE